VLGFEEGLLGGAEVGAMKGGAAGHTPEREHLEGVPFAVQLAGGFVPINLSFTAPGIALGHKRLARQEPERLLPLAHVLAHGGLGDRMVGMLLREPGPDPMGGMALLAGCLPIGAEDLFDDVSHRPDAGAWPGRARPF
jgi:hypothetical protein